MATTDLELIETVQGHLQILTGDAEDYDPIMERIGGARFALLGEASHGTHEFYRTRAEITKSLIEEKRFTGVAAEADWPDAYRVNRYVQRLSDDTDAIAALGGFRRFPTWMWRNPVVVDFVEWLRAYNDGLTPGEAKVGFYGLDLYSLRASMAAVLEYLEKVDPEKAEQARLRYACFDHFGDDTQRYGFLAGLGLTKSCEEDAVRELVELQQRALDYARRDGRVAEDEYFDAVQNARVVKNAEAYYRSMFLEDASSWNLRDRHMFGTLEALTAHLSRQIGGAKLAIWEHNSHLGDARATDMSRRGEINVGQLVFTTHHGTVTAASNWDAPPERKYVRPALPGSYELAFHDTEIPRFILTWLELDKISEILREPRLERAIGVIYRPDTERASHYFYARLPDQFDAVIHFDETTAVEPLDYSASWQEGEVPETYPFAV
jgi:erythromycin esterase-like protein